MMRPSTKLLVAVFLIGCASGALLRELPIAPARAESPATPPAPPPGIDAYEYKVLPISGAAGASEKESLLRRMGRQGWRYAGTTVGMNVYDVVFERPAVPPQAPPPAQAQPPEPGAH